jgi:hypothetical protein
MNAPTKLVRMKTGWRIQEIPAPNSLDGDTELHVEFMLIPDASIDRGICVIQENGSPLARYAGWATTASRFIEGRSDLQAVPATKGLEGALLLPALSIAEALGEFSSVERAAVCGEGPLARLVDHLLIKRGVSVNSFDEQAEVDLLVDTSGESAIWAAALSRVRDEGSVLALVPPWSKPATYDFYGQVHRRSIRLVARRWHRPMERTTVIPSDDIKTFVSTIAMDERQIRQVDLDAAPEPGVWYWFVWQ